MKQSLEDDSGPPAAAVHPGNTDGTLGLDQMVLPEEVAQAKLKWKISSAGPDGVGVAAVRQISNILLAALFSVCNSTLITPESFTMARTIFIHKKGPREDPSNYRPITIGSAVQRLYHRLLSARLNNLIETNDQQRGFKKTDGTLANTLILHHYVTSRISKGQSFNVVTLDLCKAFDTVLHSAIESSLQRTQLNQKSIRLLMSSLNNATTRVHTKGEQSAPIKIKIGVRQGDPLSPALFNLTIDSIIEQLNNNPSTGGTIGHGIKTSALAFADDLVILEDREENIPVILRRVLC